MVFYSYRLSFGVTKSADQANLLLAGADMFAGNWRLRGWSMVPDSYITMDVPLGGLITWVRALAGRPAISPSTLVLEPVLVWALLVVSLVGLAWRMQTVESCKRAAALLSLAAIGVPVMREGGATLLVFLSGIHILTIVYALAVFVLAQKILMGLRWRGALAGFALVLTLGTLGDPLLVVIATLPVVLAAMMAQAADATRRWAMGLVALLSAGAAKGLFMLNLATGGYTLTTLPVDAAGFDFAPFADLGGNISAVLQDMLANFSADFTGLAAPSAWPEVLHLPLALLACGISCGVLWRLGRSALLAGGRTDDALIVCLAAGFALDIMALLFSKRLEFEHEIATARYVFPAWAFASLLLARFASSLPGAQVLGALALGSALVFNATHVAVPVFPATEARHFRLLTALAAQGATAGCAGYWEGAMITVASQNRIKLGQCIADKGGFLVPLRLANKEFSLQQQMAAQDFVSVVRHGDPTFQDKNVLATFGQPGRRVDIEDFTLYFYPRGTQIAVSHP